jgi:hypothetical protein
VSRLALQVETSEHRAAESVCDLAENIETLCYILDGQGIPETTIRALQKCFRVCKPVVEFYFGEDSPLCWLPPTGRFTKKGAMHV